MNFESIIADYLHGAISHLCDIGNWIGNILYGQQGTQRRHLPKP